MHSSSVKEIANLARAASAKPLESVPKYIEHNGVVKSLEDLQDKRYAPRGTFKTDRVKAFETYIKDRLSAGIQLGHVNVFVDPARMAATAIFDNFIGNEQGHARDRAICHLDRTAAFKALCVIHRHKFTQKSLADWIIDWSTSIANAKNIVTAVRNITIKTVGEAKSNLTAMSAKRSVMDEVEAASSSEFQLPETIEFSCEPYLGFGSRKFAVGVQAITENDAISFVLRIESLEQVLEEISDQFALIVSEKLGVVPHIGTFEP